MESSCVSSVLHTIFLLCLMPISSLKQLHFGHCVVSMDMYEIRKGFGEIKEMTQAQDQYTSIRLLHRSYSLQDTKTEDRCCFFHYLLKFYLANVFNQCQANSNFHQRRVSRIANNFLSIKKELTLCDTVTTCPCGKEAIHRYEQILSRFERMESHSAALKALGELDILLDWIDKTELKSTGTGMGITAELNRTQV
ncbi:PREDICTED: interleukin-20 [Gekko japonicus]|uniref:Interleukin family protein n=1 Tax=Gekko japonicus TaxID=146911 RepID=A0ABM1LB04_GEKJA|nr:PREDICTED: interleukin-20 [Gekko japonicus]